MQLQAQRALGRELQDVRDRAFAQHRELVPLLLVVADRDVFQGREVGVGAQVEGGVDVVVGQVRDR